MEGKGWFFLYFDSLNVRDEEEILLDSSVWLMGNEVRSASLLDSA